MNLARVQIDMVERGCFLFWLAILLLLKKWLLLLIHLLSQMQHSTGRWIEEEGIIPNINFERERERERGRPLIVKCTFKPSLSPRVVVVVVVVLLPSCHMAISTLRKSC